MVSRDVESECRFGSLTVAWKMNQDKWWSKVGKRRLYMAKAAFRVQILVLNDASAACGLALECSHVTALSQRKSPELQSLSRQGAPNFAANFNFSRDLYPNGHMGQPREVGCSDLGRLVSPSMVALQVLFFCRVYILRLTIIFTYPRLSNDGSVAAG